MMINNQFKFEFATKRNLVLLSLLAICLFILTSTALAGGAGMEFEDVWQQIKDWSQGTLGRIIAGAMVLVGLVGGIVRQSLIALAIGIGGGLGIYNAPDIIESIVSATLAQAPAATESLQFANGLL